ARPLRLAGQRRPAAAPLPLAGVAAALPLEPQLGDRLRDARPRALRAPQRYAGLTRTSSVSPSRSRARKRSSTTPERSASSSSSAVAARTTRSPGRLWALSQLASAAVRPT